MKRIKQISILAAMSLCGAICIGMSVSSNQNPIDETVIVTIHGNVKSVDYNGRRQSAVGYTVESSSKLYTADDFVSYAIDSVSGTKAGVYAMGISSDDFCNVNPQFKNVEFVVVDGYLTINDTQATK